jgi:hypothetical protein
LFTGEEGNTLMTRRIARWMGQDSISIRNRRYSSIFTLERDFLKPWKTNVLLDGTDGVQFNPDISGDEYLSIFTPLLQRSAYYTKIEAEDNIYTDINTLNYQIVSSFMSNLRDNQDNEKYWITVSNT